MNYAGKFDANLPADGSGPHTDGHPHAETITKHAVHAPADAIIIPDSQLLFHGDFKRSGVDLVLSRDDHELVLHDYFKGEKRAALSSSDGAHLTGDIVSALTGYTQYAQADGSPSVSHVIGHVSKLAGTATAIRNGVSVILNVGDNVEKGDVVQSGANSTLGVTFIDGSVFGLSSNARMVLNEMVYDPNGSNNSSLISLVAGTISFVAGETAKHGDMKVDTPVATMGIRGTAVLCEIDFDVPGQGGAPAAHFQVLVEPDGTTGSYILFDKQTLAPLAIANVAGQQINIGQYGVNITNSPLSPDVQKLIGDVFNLRFSDSNPKSFDHFTDTIIPQSLAPIQLANGITATPVVLTSSGPGDTSGKFVLPPTNSNAHIPGPPAAVAFGGLIRELDGKTNDTTDLDTAKGQVNYADINAGDVPSVTTSFGGYTYQDLAHNDLKSKLNALQLADIKAVGEQVALVIAQDPGQKNHGSATWTYTVPDNAFDFLAAGETLTLTYIADVDNNFALNPEHTLVSFTITITGTNDVPAITTSAPTISFAAGKTTPGGDLIATVPNSTSGTLAFNDVDLTDTHTVSTALTKVQFSGTVPPTPLAAFETALTASIAADSTGSGSGTIDWKLADLPVYLADFIPAGETVTLTYTVTLEDHSATDSNPADFLSKTTQTVTVTITGTDAAAEVWIATTAAGTGDWNTGTNWETGLVPTASDDAIIITNQLQGFTPHYPVTINAGASSSLSNPDAVAKSLTMNDFGSTAPELDNNGVLEIGGGINLSADSILKNFGTLSVGALAQLLSVDGRAEILNKSVLQNSGHITLSQGGDFQDHSTITNSGTIEVAGGTLNVLVDIANSVTSGETTTSGTLQVDATDALNFATLNLESATINGGIVRVAGLLDSTGTSAIDGATIINTGTIEATTGTLTIDPGSVNNSGTLEANGGTLEIDSTPVTNTGKLLATDNSTLVLNGDTVTNSVTTGTPPTTVTTNGTVEVDAVDATHFSTLDLEGSAINGGLVTVAGLLNATGTSAITGAAITNTGTIEATTGTLTLENTTISNATDEAHNTGLLKVEAGALVDLSGVAIQHGKVSILVGGEIDTVAGTSNSIETANGQDNLSVVSFDIAGVLAVADNSSLTVNSPFNIDNSGTIALNSTGHKTYLYIDQGFAGISGGGNIILSDNINNIIAAKTSGEQLTNFDNTISGAGEIGAGGLVLVNGNDGSGGSGVIDADGSNVLLLDPTTLTNAALIEATIGGTLKLSGSIVTNFLNANAGEFLTDATSTLDVVNSSVTGGTVTNAGTLNLQGTAVLKNGKLGNGGQINVTGTGNALDGETVTANHALEIMAGAALLIDQGSSIANGGGTITVDGAAAANGEGILTLNDAHITGGTINDYSLGADHATILAGKIDVAGSSMIDGGAHLNNGNVKIEQGVSLTLDNVAVTGTSIEVDLAGGPPPPGQLFLQDGTTLANSQLTIDSGDQATANNATISGGTVANSGILDLTGAAVLKNGTLDNAGTINVTGVGNAMDGETVTANHALEIFAGGALTIDQGSTIANGGGTITVDGAAAANGEGILTLNDAHITGGTINDFSLGADNVTILAGKIDVAGSSTIDGGARLNNGNVTIEQGVTLTLDNVTVSGTDVTDKGSIELDHNVTLTGGATIEGQSTSTLGAISNLGTLEVTGLATLLNDTLTNDGNHVQVDSGSTLDFNGSTITGGTLTIAGELDSTGTSFITDATIINSSHIDVTSGTLTIDPSPVTNTGTIEAADGATLVLSGETIANFDTGGKGTIQVDASDANHGASTLDLQASTIDGGNLIVSGVLDSTGSSSIKGADITGGGTIDVTGGTLTIDAASILSSTVTLETTKDGNLIVDTDFSGSATIVGASLLDLSAGYSSATITFADDATGTLKLDLAYGIHATSSGGLTVAGLDDNTIDLGDVAYGSQTTTVSYAGTTSGGILSIFENGVDVSDIRLTGDYLGVHWNVSGDGSTGTDVSEVPGAITGLDGNGNAAEGTPITASITDGGQVVTSPQNAPEYHWQIYVDNQWVDGTGAGVTSATYTPGEGDEGYALQVAVSYVDALGNPETSTASAGTVTGTADIPIVSASASAGSTTENTATLLSGLSVQPGDASANDAADGFTAKVYVEHGALAVIDGTSGDSFLAASVTLSGDGHDTGHMLTITGTLAAVNAALAHVQYTPTSEFEGADTVHFTALSTEEIAVGGNVSADATALTATITVNGVPETAVVSTPDAQTTTENHAAITLTGLSLTPADASANDANDIYNVTLSVNDGALAVSSHDNLTGTFSGASITFSGSLADVNAALGHVSYTPTSEFEGQDTLTFTSSTTEEASVGGATSTPASHTATITVNPVAEAGTVTAPATLSLNENATKAISGVSVGPLAEDSDDSVSAVLAVTHGTLHVNSPDGVTVANDGTTSVTVSGSAASVNTVLASLTYTATTEYEGTDTLNVTVTSKDGSSTSATLGQASTAITVIPIAPVFTSPASISGTAQEASTLTAGGTLNESDVVVTYQWESANTSNGTYSNIAGATSSTYTLQEADEGKFIKVVETATDSDGGPSTTSTSAATAAVAEASLVPNITATSNTHGTATFHVNFAVAMSGVTSSDFTLFTTHDGITLFDNINVSGSGANYTVTVTYPTGFPNFLFSESHTSLGLNFVNNIFSLVHEAGDNSAAVSTHITTPQFSSLAPAGLAGYAINMGLMDPTLDPGDVITLTIAGAAADWTLNSGTHNSDGSWTVQTNDPASLMVTPSASFVGAALIQVTESWTNPDGTTGNALVTDNVEAYAPGSPIFALAGDDHLTGAGANDLFVFAQPIGHDVIYNFNAASDKIDLIDFSNVSSFADIQGHIADDANGNAVITVGTDETITLNGVHAAAVTASDFAFDQAPVTQNAGNMTIGDGAILPLSGTINNTGTIELNSAGHETDLQLTEHGMTLQGGGQVVLSDNAENVIAGTSADVTLTNVDNTISGAGQIGAGQLTLVNEGTIDATGTNSLGIDTGVNAVTNSGTLEAMGSGGLVIQSDVVNSGLLWANGGNVTVQGEVSGNGIAKIDGAGALDFEAPATANVVFGSGAAGTLKLEDSFHFNGTISGFAGADVIDLASLGSTAASISYHENAAGTGGTLAISNGAQTAELSFLGNYSADNFSLAPDQAKGTLVTYVPHHDLVV